MRETGHRDGVGPLIARGDGQAEQGAGTLGVLAEHLVEVAHPEEQQRVGVAGLELAILLHHRGRGGVAHRESVALVAPRRLQNLSRAVASSTEIWKTWSSRVILKTSRRSGWMQQSFRSPLTSPTFFLRLMSLPRAALER